ncbi:MAG: hypothetical protein ABUK01_15140, partial [Leptospirales bacterium]
VDCNRYFCLEWDPNVKEKVPDADDDWGDDDEIRKVLDGGVYLEDTDKEDIEEGISAWNAMPDNLREEIKVAFPNCSLKRITVRSDEIETGYWSKEDFMATEDPVASLSGALSIIAKLGNHLATK